MLDNGTDAENRFELIDMRSTALNYTGEEGKKITRGIYEKIVDGLDRLNKILAL